LDQALSAASNYYDLSPLKAIMKDDEDFLLLMLHTFLRSGKENIVALDSCLLTKSSKTIGEVAHKMLNSYRQLAISETIHDLEQLELLIEIENPDFDVVKKSILNIKHISEIVFRGIEEEIVNLETP